MIKRIFWEGIKAIVPIGVVIAIAVWIFDAVEHSFGALIRVIIGSEYYVPGMGLVFGLVLIFFVGLAMNAWIGRKIHDLGERIVKKIPLIKTLYNSMTDMMSFFEQKGQRREGRVVMISLGEVRLLGIVTRETFEELPKAINPHGEVAVLIPMSYNTGGFTIYVPKSMLTPMEVSVEHALRFTVTAGMVTKK